MIKNKWKQVSINKSPADIANALQHVWQNKDIYSQNALKLSKKYDIAKATALWLDLYNRLIQSKNMKSLNIYIKK